MNVIRQFKKYKKKQTQANGEATSKECLKSEIKKSFFEE